MLIHVVCWRYKKEIDAVTRDRHRAMLRSLNGLVGGIHSLDVGEDILHLERSYDTGLVVKFTDRRALDQYSEHREHQEVALMGRQISEHVVSVDFIA